MFGFFKSNPPTEGEYQRIEFPENSKTWRSLKNAIGPRDPRSRPVRLTDRQLYALFEYIDTLEDRIAKLEERATSAPNPVPALYSDASSTGTFGAALQQLGEGKRVARAGWVQWNTYIWLMPPASVPREHIKEPHLKELCGDADSIEVHGCIRMLTYEGKVMTGWAPNQADMQATDWVVVE